MMTTTTMMMMMMMMIHPSAVPFFLTSVAYDVFFFFLCVHPRYTIHSMFGSCSTQNPNCFYLMGRGVAWTATTASVAVTEGSSVRRRETPQGVQDLRGSGSGASVTMLFVNTWISS